MSKIKKDHRTVLIANALEAAKVYGYKNVNRAMAAEGTGLSRTMVNIHIGSLEDLTQAIREEALASECIPVIAQMLVFRDDYVTGGLAPKTMEKVFDFMRG